MKKLFTFLFLITFTLSLFAQRPIVQDITAFSGKGKTININWTLPENPDAEITELLIYRSTEQISSYSDIEKLEPLARLEGWYTNYQDKVEDFKDYFYAVIAVTNAPYKLVIINVNSTVKGAHINPKKITNKKAEKTQEERVYENGKLRETPLPFVSFVEGLNQEGSISEETTEAAKTLSFTKADKDDLLRPFVFEEDLVSPDGGDDYLLFEILKNNFAPKNYEGAIEQLLKLLGTNINENTRNRAYFYIGESYYFLENYNEAIMNFIRVENVFPIQAKRWIDSSLDQL